MIPEPHWAFISDNPINKKQTIEVIFNIIVIPGQMINVYFKNKRKRYNESVVKVCIEAMKRLYDDEMNNQTR